MCVLLISIKRDDFYIMPCIYSSLCESVHQLSRIPVGATSAQYYQYFLHK